MIVHVVNVFYRIIRVTTSPPLIATANPLRAKYCSHNLALLVQRFQDWAKLGIVPSPIHKVGKLGRAVNADNDNVNWAIVHFNQ
jgi:hypothetical protein